MLRLQQEEEAAATAAAAATDMDYLQQVRNVLDFWSSAVHASVPRSLAASSSFVFWGGFFWPRNVSFGAVKGQRDLWRKGLPLSLKATAFWPANIMMCYFKLAGNSHSLCAKLHRVQYASVVTVMK